MNKLWFMLSISILMIGCSENEISSYPKDITYLEGNPANGDYLEMKGRWKANSNMPFQRLPVINSVFVECYERDRICKEELAFLYTKLDQDVANKKIPPNYLRAISFEYKITQWTRDSIIATYKAPAADIEIRINIAQDSAERIFRETSERGSKEANPVTLLWVLN